MMNPIRWLSVCGSVFTLVATAQAAEPPQPVAHWSFDQGAGERAEDLSGNGNHGTIRGAAWIELGDGHALQFDGKDDVVACKTTAALNMEEAVTVSAWVWPQRVPDQHVGLAGKSQVHYALTFYKNRRVYWFLNAGSNKVSAPLPTGRWTHVAATFDGKKLRLFLNGDLASEADSRFPRVRQGGAFSIGRVASRPEYSPIGTWPGRIDEVCVYDQALNKETVAEMYQKQKDVYHQDSLSLDTDWQAAPAGVRPEAVPPGLEAMPGQTTIKQADGYSDEPLPDGGWRFQIRGLPPSERSMRWRRGLKPDEVQGDRWFMLRYRAEGFRRARNVYPVVTVEDGDQTRTLLESTQVVNDGLEHTVVGRLPDGLMPRALTVEVSTQGRSAYLDVIDVTFADDLREPVRALDKPGPWRPLDLTGRDTTPLNETVQGLIEEHGTLTDPFAAFPGGAEAVLMPEQDFSINRQKLPFFGEMIERQHLRPVSRATHTDIPVNDQVAEVLLLLVSDAAPVAKHYMVASTPTHIADVQTFAVELIYNDGTRDWAFPYSVADGGYAIRRAVGRYAVAADPARTLATVRLHNRRWGLNIGVAGVAINPGPDRVYPQLVAEPEPHRTAEPGEVVNHPDQVRREGEQVVIQSGMAVMRIDLSDGFAITAFAPATENLSPDSGLLIQHDGGRLTGRDFEVAEARVDRNLLHLTLQSPDGDPPVRIELTIAAEDGQIVFDGAMHNTSDAPLSVDLRVPYLDGLRIGDLADNWLFFPKYRNVLSEEHGTHVALNDSAFPLQFYDVFNPELGQGIALLTRNRSLAPLQYRLAKDEGGVTASVAYPADNHGIEPGGSLSLVPTALAGHTGDWRQALGLYQQWRRSWYEHHQARDRAWFERAFFMRSTQIDDFAGRRIAKTPGWYTGKPGAFRIDEALGAIRRYWGFLPDILHVRGWFHKEKGGIWSWGDYDYTEFAVGGLESFRKLLRTLEEEHGIHTSLYTLTDRASKGTRIGERIGDEAVRIRPDGSKVEAEFAWYFDPTHPKWRDYYVQTLERIERDTGIDTIYLDVFSFKQGHMSYKQRNGYRAPDWPNRATYEMIIRVKEALPDTVPIWSEYPLDDVSSQFHDGNIAYYYLTLHEHFVRSFDVRQVAPMLARPYLNVYRFALPHMKQFDFPVGIEGDLNPSRLRMVFFNGEALYDATWRLYGNRLRRWIGRGIEVQRAYADCFASENVAMLVPTRRHGVYANRFTGDGRTAWTIYNGRFRTIRGELIAIPHVEGATYTDAWRDRPLRPRIEGGMAIIELELDPQAAGCVVQTLPDRRAPSAG